MKLNEYQEEAKKTAIYPKAVGIIYTTLGLTGEAGEVANKVKKVIRDNGGVFTDEKIKEVSKEIGDTIWYLANLCEELGLSLETVAKENLDKLQSRKRRGTLHGEGDTR